MNTLPSSPPRLTPNSSCDDLASRASTSPPPPPPPRDATVAIIGAGVSGLMTAYTLERCGAGFAKPVVFERTNDVAGVWSQYRYPNITLQNSLREYKAPGVPWPTETRTHPTGLDTYEYWRRFVHEFDVDVRVNSNVDRADVAEDGGWDVTVTTTTTTTPSNEASSTFTNTHHFDHLIIAAGHYTTGKVGLGDLPNANKFRGSLMSELDVASLDAMTGRRIVVVGFGKSALDVACNAVVARAAAVHHVFRTPRWTFRQWVFGINMTYFLMQRITTSLVPGWSQPVRGARIVHDYAPWLVAAFWGALQALVRMLIWLDAGLVSAACDTDVRRRIHTVIPNDHGLVDDLRSSSVMAPPAFYPGVARGAIEPHHATVAGFTEDGAGVILSDGAIIPDVDVVVASLGCARPTFPYLPESMRRVLEREEDADGCQLYRHLVHPDVPNVGFAGYNHGYMHVPSTLVGALWLAAYFRGRMRVPSRDEQLRVAEAVATWKRQHMTFEPSRNFGANMRFQQYNDAVLADVGVSPYRKSTPWAETFARYGADDYAGAIDEFRSVWSRTDEEGRWLKGAAPRHRKQAVDAEYAFVSSADVAM